MSGLEFYSCRVLKYASLVPIFYGVVALAVSFCSRDAVRTKIVVFLYGVDLTVCGVLMFCAMRAVSWELYMLSWVLLASAAFYIQLIECPPPESKMARSILSTGKALCIDITGKRGAKDE